MGVVLLPGMNKEFLASCIRPKDLLNEDCVSDNCDAAELVQRCATVVRWGFPALKLESILIKGKTAHLVKSTPHAIVLRGLNVTVRRATRLKPADRDTIIRRLATVLGEGVEHREYKFDIKSFFESLDTKSLAADMASVTAIPRSAVRVLENYFTELEGRGIKGLPRGISLSATLSEWALSNFDKKISSLPDVYFNARYVDDIVIVTGARETPGQFIKKIKSLLAPLKLELNPDKTQQIHIPGPPQASSTNRVVGQFDYLGYSFAVHEAKRAPDRRFYREVDVSIAKTKIARLKSRLCLAVCAFLADGSIGDFERRLQLLTGNYNLRDFVNGRQRNTGLYCNYRRANTSEGLKEIDAFFRSLVVGGRSRLAKRLSQKVPIGLRRSLLKYNFVRSFNEQVFYNFTLAEIAELRRCWRDV
jgi:hypothetical protein